jgi:hypothetical protein
MRDEARHAARALRLAAIETLAAQLTSQDERIAQGAAKELLRVAGVYPDAAVHVAASATAAASTSTSTSTSACASYAEPRAPSETDALLDAAQGVFETLWRRGDKTAAVVFAANFMRTRGWELLQAAFEAAVDGLYAQDEGVRRMAAAALFRVPLFGAVLAGAGVTADDLCRWARDAAAGDGRTL